MKDLRPMVFSAPMVVAILNGKKTQTRRMFKRRQPPAVGDVLWVREAMVRDGQIDPHAEYEAHREYRFREDVIEWSDAGPVGRRPWRIKRERQGAIFMPKAAHRLRLDVLAVRQECVVDISEDDAVAEGFKDEYSFGTGHRTPASERFRDYWRRLHGHESWSPDTQVYVVTFRPWVAIRPR